MNAILIASFVLLAVIVVAGVGIALAARSAKRALDETPVIPRKAAYFRAAKDTSELIDQIASSLKTSGISEYQRQTLAAQMQQTRQSLNAILARLDKVNTAKLAAGKGGGSPAAKTLLAEAETMEQNLTGELERIHETLLGMQVGLLKVDVARGGKPLDQMMSDLGEMNAQLNDSAGAYKDLQEGDLEREMRKNRMSN